jgi:ribosomal protein S18 acetylase RimI-like enzyme
VIRQARAEDDGALQELDLIDWEITSPAPLPPADRPFFDSGRGVFAEDVLVAEREGVIVGYVRIGHPTKLPSNAHVVEIQGISVAPSVRRAGVGTLLLHKALEAAETRGATRIRLRVLGSNPGAQALYERCGFVVEGVLRGEFVLDGVPVDDLLMARAL